jgi:hypothetical protein
MGRVQVPLATRFNAGRSRKWTSENLVNMYAEPSRGLSASQVVLYSAPTPRIFAATGAAANVRGQINAAGTHVAVIGNSLYTVDSTGAVVNRGFVDGSGLVDMAFDGGTVSIVTSARAYVYVPSSGALNEILDPDLLNPTSCCTVDEYTLFTRRGTGTFQWSDLSDATSYNALSFASAETSPDNLIAVRASQQEVILFGEDSIEFFRNTGDPQQIFQRSTGAAPIEAGCVSRDAIAVMDNSFFWLGRDRNSNGLLVYRAQGYAAQRVSNHAVETLLEGYTNLTEVEAFSYAQRGHTFYVLTLPDYVTLVYDAATQEWHQRAQGLWSGNSTVPLTDSGLHTFAMNGARPVQRPIVGREDGNLYELSFDTFAASGTVDDVFAGAAYTFVAGDAKLRKVRTHTGAMGDTFPQAGTAGFGSGVTLYVANKGSGNLTITPTTSTINTAATLVIAPGDEYRIVSDNVNYQAFPYTHVGVTREVTLPPMYAGGALQTFIGFELICETGVGSDVGDADPQVELWWSDDGGAVWKGGLAKSIGRVGERQKRVRWRQNMGRARERMFRIKIASPVNFTVLDAYAYVGGAGEA